MSDHLPTPTLRSPNQVAGWEWAAAGGDPDKGVTVAGLAAAGDVGTGTASGWLAKWRAELDDPDLFKDDAARARAEQTQAARETARIRYIETRGQMAYNSLITADSARNRIFELIDAVGTSWVDRGVDGAAQPVVVYGPRGTEIERLATAVAKLVESAELLADNPTRHTRRSVPGDQWVPPAGGDTGQQADRETKVAKVLDLRARLLEKATGS